MARLNGVAPPVLRPPQMRPAMPVAVKLSGTRKHQINLLSAAGYTQGMIAKRLGLTVGVVAGVLHRSRAEEHRLLMGDAMALLFGLGFDTYEIGSLVGEPEHVVVNTLARSRDRGGKA